LKVKKTDSRVSSGLVLFSLHLEIHHPILACKRPRRIGFRNTDPFGLAEAHIFAHGVGPYCIHVQVSEPGVGAE